MRIPRLAERMKGAPVQTLRALFTGIGQAIMASDRLIRGEEERKAAGPPPAGGDAPARPNGASPPSQGPVRPAAASRADREGREAAAGARERWRSLDETGNVRLITPDELAEMTDVTGPARPPGPAASAGADAGSAEPDGLPVPGYDGLSIASLRARLRRLSPSDLRVLIGYERVHAARPDVLTMLERRLARLDSGSG
jgi:hypothetical protein